MNLIRLSGIWGRGQRSQDFRAPYSIEAARSVSHWSQLMTVHAMGVLKVGLTVLLGCMTSTDVTRDCGNSHQPSTALYTETAGVPPTCKRPAESKTMLAADALHVYDRSPQEESTGYPSPLCATNQAAAWQHGNKLRPLQYWHRRPAEAESDPDLRESRPVARTWMYSRLTRMRGATGCLALSP